MPSRPRSEPRHDSEHRPARDDGARFRARVAARAALVGADRSRDRGTRRCDLARRSLARRCGGARIHAALRWPRGSVGRGAGDFEERAASRARRDHASATQCPRRCGAPRAQLPRAPARCLRPLVALSRRRRHAARPEGHAARSRRHLRAGRQGCLSLVLADGSTPPDWVAMDLFSQAEHDEMAQSILLCPDASYIARVKIEIDRLLPAMPRRDVIRASLEGRGALIVTRSMEESCAISNRVAPEHLEVSSRDPHRWEPLLKHAGAIFLGAFTSESLGDYCAGPNHVLPTAGTARFSSPLGVYDFQKRSSLIEVSEAGAQVLGPIAAELAYGEGLQAHARAAELRLKGNAP